MAYLPDSLVAVRSACLVGVLYKYTGTQAYAMPYWILGIQGIGRLRIGDLEGGRDQGVQYTGTP